MNINFSYFRSPIQQILHWSFHYALKIFFCHFLSFALGYQACNVIFAVFQKNEAGDSNKKYYISKILVKKACEKNSG